MFVGRYRRWKLGDDIDLIVRCEHDGVMTGANGEVSFINIKTLNEWDSRVRKNRIPKLALTASLLPDMPGTAGRMRQISGVVPRALRSTKEYNFGGQAVLMGFSPKCEVAGLNPLVPGCSAQ